MKNLKLVAAPLNGEEVRIVCPICGCEQAHIVNVTNTIGMEEYTDKEFRQGAVKITLECESDEAHKITYVFGEHKGDIIFQTLDEKGEQIQF